MRIQVVTGRPAALRTAFVERVAELRREDPLAPITVLVGASLQRPFLQRWLAARLGAHANVRILMPGDLALLLGAPALVAAERRALPPLADRVLLAEVARKHPGTSRRSPRHPGSARRCSGWCGSSGAPAYDLSDLGRAARRRDRRAREGRFAGGDPGRVRASARRLLRPGRRAAGGRAGPARRARAARVGDARPAAGARAPALRRRGADAGRRLPPRRRRRRADAPLGELRRAADQRWCEPNVAPAIRPPRDRRSTGSDGRCSRRRPSRRSQPTGRCGSCRRRTRRARCAPPRARACSGRGRACRSGRWRSPTGTARRTCRSSRRCSSRPGSRCTCTRARRWRSARSDARRSRCWRCSTAISRASR